jgi:hypothetical protein
MKYLKLFEDYSDNTYYHVGLMNIANKSDISYEGSGLSISKHPEEWQKINPLTSGDLFELKKRTPIFFDYYKEKDSIKRSVIKWGIDNNFVEEITTYKVCWYNDEIEDELCMFFDNKNDAIDEAGDYGVDIIIDKGYKATNKLKQMSLQKSIGIDNTFDILLTVYLDNNTEYDGIWWEEELDVLKYSAPRGVIFNSKLKTWDIKKID